MSHSVNSSGCSYTTLQNYNGFSDNNRLAGNSSSSKSEPPIVVVPGYGGFGYHIKGLNPGFQDISDSGYFNVTKAYGNDERAHYQTRRWHLCS